MKTITRKKLARAGWRTGTAEEFLGLKAEETALVNLRVAPKLRRGKARRRVASAKSGDKSPQSKARRAVEATPWTAAICPRFSGRRPVGGFVAARYAAEQPS